MGQGATQWEQSLRSCQEGRGSVEMLQGLCTDLQKSIRLWLDLRLAQSPVSPTVLSHAIRAVQVCSFPGWAPHANDLNVAGCSKTLYMLHCRRSLLQDDLSHPSISLLSLKCSHMS